MGFIIGVFVGSLVTSFVLVGNTYNNKEELKHYIKEEILKDKIDRALKCLKNNIYNNSVELRLEVIKILEGGTSE